MTPESGDFTEFDIDEHPTSETWAIDFEKGIVTGRCDGIEAVRQAVFIILSTDRYRHVIYDRSYGSELNTLIHRPPAVVRSETKRMIEDALMQDDRILSVSDFDISTDREILTVSCTVKSMFGEFSETFTQTQTQEA